MEPCTQIHRIERLEQDIKGLQKTDREHAKDIGELKEGQAENRMFQRLILDQLAEIKTLINVKKSSPEKPSTSPNKEWIDLIKWVLGGTIIAIVAWMVANGFGG